MARSHVELIDVTMKFGERTVFEDRSCTFPKGKISVILGGSGSGKSTMLRLVAGLVRPTAGHVMVAGDDFAKLSESKIIEARNNLGMMFQGGALLDSLSVYENVAFPLREHTHFTESEIRERVHSCLQSVGLKQVDELLPGELSGGMLKRVALARALIQSPVIVLVDEPFSGLDPVSVKLIESLLVRINRQFDMTMLIVSHHIPSTMRMADNVVLILEDDLVQGPPQEVAENPNARVRRFFSEASDYGTASSAATV